MRVRKLVAWPQERNLHTYHKLKVGGEAVLLCRGVTIARAGCINRLAASVSPVNPKKRHGPKSVPYFESHAPQGNSLPT